MLSSSSGTVRMACGAYLTVLILAPTLWGQDTKTPADTSGPRAADRKSRSVAQRRGAGRADRRLSPPHSRQRPRRRRSNCRRSTIRDSPIPAWQISWS